jgi:cyclic pyranopterin phosphate synthase
MPEGGNRFLPEEALMTRGEIARIAALLQRLGVRKLRLTGGEPTLRGDLVGIVEELGRLALPGGLALSTNGILFVPIAGDLRRAGLDRVNISVDALSDDAFRMMTRRDRLGRVREAVDAALALDYESVKLNAVILRGWNEGEIPPLVDLARTLPVEVRFIELMPFGSNDWKGERLVSAAEIRSLIEREERLRPVEKGDFPGPAESFTADGWRGRVGFITPVSAEFCERCNRLRLTPDGKIRACLFGLEEVDWLGPLRGGASDERLEEILREAVWRKAERHPLHPGMKRDDLLLDRRDMNEVGG